MTDKQIIIEKGNQKCIFYNDDICRKGDKTRDCLNCARVEYHSLYKVNWENQERLESQLKAKEQECEGLKAKCKKYGEINEQETKDYAELKAELDRANCQIADDEILQCDMREAVEELKAENDELKRQHQGDKGLITATGKMNYELLQEYDKLKTALTEIKEIVFPKNQLIITDSPIILKIQDKISECEVDK